MTHNEIKDRLISLVKECVPDLEDAELTEKSKINTDKAVDSMAFIYLMSKIEATFDIRIPQKKWRNMMTLEDIIAEVEAAVSKKKA